MTDPITHIRMVACEHTWHDDPKIAPACPVCCYPLTSVTSIDDVRAVIDERVERDFNGIVRELTRKQIEILLPKILDAKVGAWLGKRGEIVRAICREELLATHDSTIATALHSRGVAEHIRRVCREEIDANEEACFRSTVRPKIQDSASAGASIREGEVVGATVASPADALSSEPEIVPDHRDLGEVISSAKLWPPDRDWDSSCVFPCSVCKTLDLPVWNHEHYRFCAKCPPFGYTLREPTPAAKCEQVGSVCSRRECTLPAGHRGDCEPDIPDYRKRKIEELTEALAQAEHRIAELERDREQEIAGYAAIMKELVQLREARDAERAAFKNFHRAMCERFGYAHDEKDWKRDQASLEEWIAKKLRDARDDRPELHEPSASDIKAVYDAYELACMSGPGDGTVTGIRAALRKAAELGVAARLPCEHMDAARLEEILASWHEAARECFPDDDEDELMVDFIRRLSRELSEARELGPERDTARKDAEEARMDLVKMERELTEAILEGDRCRDERNRFIDKSRQAEAERDELLAKLAAVRRLGLANRVPALHEPSDRECEIIYYAGLHGPEQGFARVRDTLRKAAELGCAPRLPCDKPHFDGKAWPEEPVGRPYPASWLRACIDAALECGQMDDEKLPDMIRRLHRELTEARAENASMKDTMARGFRECLDLSKPAIQRAELLALTQAALVSGASGREAGSRAIDALAKLAAAREAMK